MVADITLVLEGSYPYVRGGVSSWVHQIIRGLPEFSFSILFLGTAPEHYNKMMYELPANVKHFNTIYLSNNKAFKRITKHKINKKTYSRLQTIFDHIKTENEDDFSYFDNIISYYKNGKTSKFLENKDFYNSREAWELITSTYEQCSKEPSFLNYIWNFRAIYEPILEVINSTPKIKKTKIVHTISTGYAGLCASIISQVWEVPLILTEHGIYNKERKIDIFRSQWLTNDKNNDLTNIVRNDGGYLKDMWIQSFSKLSKFTYNFSSPIISLYEGNKTLQIRDGAKKERTQIIPNGISLQRFSNLIEKRTEKIPKIIGLIGRVVSIKDIKTYISSILEIRNEIPDIQAWVIGPEEEEPEYVKECKLLVKNFELEEHFHFKGFQKVEDIYPKLGLCALTSLSEAQPLVVLEAFAAGVPCVTTDVGCCTELIYGVGEEDCKLGAAGRVVPISAPVEFAKASIELLNNKEKWLKAQQAGIKRVNKYYTETRMLQNYKKLYTEIIKK